MIYVDCSKGSDTNSGSIDKPVKSVGQAVLLWRGQKTVQNVNGTIYVREGTYYFNETLQLGPEDSKQLDGQRGTSGQHSQVRSSENRSWRRAR